MNGAGICTLILSLQYKSMDTTSSSTHDRISLLGCPIDIIEEDDVLKKCITWCVEHSKGNQIVTINAQSLLLTHDDPIFAEAISNSSFIVADGISLMLAARVLRLPLKKRVTGIDLMVKLLEEGSRRHLKFFFLGATNEVLDAMTNHVRQRYPGVQIAGQINGYFSVEEEPSIVERIHKCDVDILLVGMPTPRKEVLIYRYKKQLNASVAIGVGGSFDVMAGKVSRAPLWMQRAGLEWLWRLMLEPRKMLKRNIVYNTRFLVTLAKEYFHNHLLKR